MRVRPRRALLNPALQRPDWQKNAPRPPGPLWLDKNENADPQLYAVIREVLAGIDPLALSTYPESAALYRKLGRHVDLPPEYLILTPGSDGAIRATFEAFVDEGDPVLHTVPTFAMYDVYCKMFGARAETLEYEPGAQGPVLSAASVVAGLERVRPRLLCLPNPDSPTGTVIAADELRDVVARCAAIGTIALIDEAYHPFYDWTCMQWTREFRNLVVARTFAKAWGLAGLRIGYAAGHPDTIQYLHKMRPMYEAGTFSIAFMERMLDHAGAMLASVRRLNQGKKFFGGKLRTLGFDVLPTHGNFLHVAFGDGAATIHRALEGKVLYRREFRERCLMGYSRFSATTEDAFAPIVRAIEGALKGHVDHPDR